MLFFGSPCVLFCSIINLSACRSWSPCILYLMNRTVQSLSPCILFFWTILYIVCLEHPVYYCSVLLYHHITLLWTVLSIDVLDYPAYYSAISNWLTHFSGSHYILFFHITLYIVLLCHPVSCFSASPCILLVLVVDWFRQARQWTTSYDRSLTSWSLVSTLLTLTCSLHTFKVIWQDRLSALTYSVLLLLWNLRKFDACEKCVLQYLIFASFG